MRANCRRGSTYRPARIRTLAGRPLAHLRRAELYARMGDTELAAHHYERFAYLWRHADDELQPLVQQAREAAALLR